MARTATESILGQRIKWNVVTYAWRYDYDRARTTGENPRQRHENVVTTRTGIVWSAGPTPGTAWVIPDERGGGEGHAVCVLISKNGEHTARPIDAERSTSRDQAIILGVRRMRGDYLARGAADVRVNL